MKYKTRKTNISKYISSEAKKEISKKNTLKKQIAASIIFVSVMFSLSGFGIVKRPVIQSVFGYVSHVSDIFSPEKIKNSKFLKNAGEHIFDFCFGYLKHNENEKTSVHALSKKNEEAATEKPATVETPVESDSDVHSDAQAVYIEESVLAFEPIMPCEGEVSSEFGNRVHPVSGETKFHNGIDIAADEGTKIFACEEGITDIAAFNDYSGKHVIISHEDGYTSSYSHMSYLLVTPGTKVKKGDVIGLVGSTGIATGPHLHFEIKKDGTCIDPKEIIKE